MQLERDKINELKDRARAVVDFESTIEELNGKEKRVAVIVRGAGMNVYGGRMVVLRPNRQVLVDYRDGKVTRDVWLTEARPVALNVDKVAARKKFMGVDTWQPNDSDIFATLELTRIYQKT